MLKVCYYYSLKFLKHSGILPVAAVIQIAIAVVLLNFAVGSLRGACMQLIYTKGLNDENLYLVQPSAAKIHDGEYSLTDEESSIYFENLINGYCAEQGIAMPEHGSDEYYSIINSFDCFIRYATQQQEENLLYLYDDLKNAVNSLSEDAEIYALHDWQFPPNTWNGLTISGFTMMDEELAERVYLNLEKGKQLSKTNNKGSVIEAIAYGDAAISERFRIGDEKEIQIYNYEDCIYETYTVRIVGMLGSPYYSMEGIYVNFDSADTVNLDQLAARNVVSDDSSYCGLLIKPFEGFSVEKYQAGYGSWHFFVNTAGTDMNTAELETTLTSAGYELANMHTVWENSFSEIFASIASYCMMLLISGMMTVLTLLGIAVLHVSNHWKTHQIMHITGASHQEHVTISTLLLTHLLTLGTGLGAGGIWLYDWYQKTDALSEYFGIILDRLNLWFTLSVYLLLIVLFNLVFRVLFRNRKGGV